MPDESDKTTSNIHADSLLKAQERPTSTPSPAGIVAPVKLNPITVLPPDETVKPASSAAPPPALFIDAPSILN